MKYEKHSGGTDGSDRSPLAFCSVKGGISMDKNWTTWNTQAMQALDRGDIEQAERAFRQACGSGDPRADSNLGWFYFLMGGSVRDSEAEARYWIQRPCSAPAIRSFSRISPGCGSKTAILPGRLPRFRRRTKPTKAPFCSIISVCAIFGWETKPRLRPASARQTQ